MKKRIYGLETEYNLALIDKDGCWRCEERNLTSYLNPWSPCKNAGAAKEFRENGSKIYLEGGYHPEYCTAECLDLIDLIAQDKAGEGILKKTAARRADEKGKIVLFKNNVDYGKYENDLYCKTCGCHENFLIDRKLTVKFLEKILIPFLVARQAICGAGWVADDFYQETKIPYMISQRTKFIGTAVSQDTNTAARAIFSTARLSEVHADAEKYLRLHLILGDSNMSEVCTYLKMGLTGILLEMMEEDYPFTNIIGLFNPVSALKQISHDLTCKEPVAELSDRRNFSALDILEHYLEMMDDYEKIQGLSPEFCDVKNKFADILERLKRRRTDGQTGFEENSEGLDEEIDWLIKKSSLEESLLFFGCDWNNFYDKNTSDEDNKEQKRNVFDQIRAKDLKYHELSENGLYNIRQLKISPSKLRGLGIRTSRITEEEKIIEAEDVPPQNTRAKLRGDFIRLLLKKEPERQNELASFSFDWETISWRGGIISLLDPFETENDELAKLAAKIENNDFSFITASDYFGQLPHPNYPY